MGQALLVQCRDVPVTSLCTVRMGLVGLPCPIVLTLPLGGVLCMVTFSSYINRHKHDANPCICYQNIWLVFTLPPTTEMPSHILDSSLWVDRTTQIFYTLCYTSKQLPLISLALCGLLPWILCCYFYGIGCSDWLQVFC